MTEQINPNYHIPESFLHVIEPYINGKEPKVFMHGDDLINMWQQALTAHVNAPQYSEHIAEWAMSAGASSPLLSDPRYEEIHVLFGQAEVEAVDSAIWKDIQELVANLSESIPDERE